MDTAVWTGWLRHIIGVAAGGVGVDAYLNMSVEQALVSVVMGGIAFGWSYMKNKKVF